MNSYSGLEGGASASFYFIEQEILTCEIKKKELRFAKKKQVKFK